MYMSRESATKQWSANLKNISFDDDEDISVEDTATDPRWDGLQNILENN